MDSTHLTPVVLARANEQLRQERVSFDQAKQHEGRWFVLRLVMGYSAVFILGAIMIVASYVLFNSALFPASVVTTAGAALFVDVLGLLVAVWKIALNPNFYPRIAPVTRVELTETQADTQPTGNSPKDHQLLEIGTAFGSGREEGAA